MPRVVEKDYTYRRWMERVASKHGAFVRDGSGWSDEDNDLLLEGFLVHGWVFDAPPGEDCFANVLKRSRDAVRRQLAKLSVRYTERGDVSGYAPKDRTDRTLYHPGPLKDGVITDRERAVLMTACSPEGRKNGAHKPDYLAKILGRWPDDVRTYLRECYEESNLLDTMPLRGETESGHHARIAYETWQSLGIAPGFEALL